MTPENTHRVIGISNGALASSRPSAVSNAIARVRSAGPPLGARMVRNTIAG